MISLSGPFEMGRQSTKIPCIILAGIRLLGRTFLNFRPFQARFALPEPSMRSPRTQWGHGQANKMVPVGRGSNLCKCRRKQHAIHGDLTRVEAQ